MFKTVSVCRACGLGAKSPPTLKESAAAGPPANGDALQRVFGLGLQPLANDFCTQDEEQAGFAPVEVMLCPNCSMAQLSVTVNPSVLYRNYRYVTSPSRTMQEHFQCFVTQMGLASRPARILEIGSNDGLFLEFLKNKGHAVLGVDPAENLAQKARSRNVESICGFWTSQLGAEISSWGPDFVVARHVFCHAEDWLDFMKGIEQVSHPGTVALIEVPYVQDLLEKGEFDTIYHEHTSYLSVRAISALLARTNLRLIKIDRLTIHGGALLLHISRKDSKHIPHKSVSTMLNSESCGVEQWRLFSSKSHDKIHDLQMLVCSARAQGKRVVGYGASAKSTVWIAACGFRRRDIEFITDTTPEKLYRFSPGTDIPIVDEFALTRELPDYAICFCWNFWMEVVKKEKAFLKQGGKWIIPHPEIKVIDYGQAQEFI